MAKQQASPSKQKRSAPPVCKNDLSLSGAELEQLGEKGASLLSAGRDVRIGAVHTDNYAQGITDSDNYLKDRTVKTKGSPCWERKCTDRGRP